MRFPRLLTLAGPNTLSGLVWGLGATFKYPTASDDALGQGKYQAGPDAMVLNIGENWLSSSSVAEHQVKGIFALGSKAKEPIETSLVPLACAFRQLDA